MSPDGVYAVSKAMAHLYVQSLRSVYVRASNAILSNSESERKSTGVVTAICSEAASIKHCLDMGQEPSPLRLRTLESKRDWSHSADVANAIVRLSDLPHGLDVRIASGKMHTVRDVVDVAFSFLGLPNWKPYVIVDTDRSDDDDPPEAETWKLRSMGWSPKYDFKGMVERIVGAHAEKLEGTVVQQ